MTTAQTMLARARPAIVLVLGALVALAPAACATKKPIPRPTQLATPYHGHRPVVWAVAPLRNESGISIVDELALSDALVNELQQAHGISALPVNRTLAALRALRLGGIDTAAEAMAVCNALGADAVIVGTITAWRPYDPPTLGLSLALFGRDPANAGTAPAGIDPVRLRASPTEVTWRDTRSDQPLSAVAVLLDAHAGDTLEAVRRYATGRHDPDAPFGWRRYTASMALYAKFACHETARQLIDAERARFTGSSARAEAADTR